MFLNKNCKYNGVFDETKFIIGIDMGNSDSALSFFDFNTKKVEQLDISGGYGKASVPTVVQYIKDTEEWVFGEYALMNKPLSDSVTFDNLISGLGKKNCYAVGKKVLSHSYILSLFIKELLGNVKNINPNAEIIGIAVSVSALNEEGEEELVKAFSEAGYYDRLIGFFFERECILNKFCYDEKNLPHRIFTLDFGDRGLRGVIYELFEDEDNNKNNNIIVNTVSAFSENNVTTANIESKLYHIFEEYFKENTGETNISNIHKLQLEAFSYQHKDLIFKSNGNIKLYFNFVYPPFQKSIEKENVEGITLEFRGAFYRFIEEIYKRADLNGKKNGEFKMDRVICCGGGFEMKWIRQAAIDAFGESRCLIYKNPKNVLSQGACIIAVKHFNAFNAKNIIFSESVALTQDIGLIFREKSGGEKFVSFIKRGTFWWHKFDSKAVIINDVDGEIPFLEVFKKDKDGNLIIISRIPLDDLPKRPKGTNCFDVLFNYIEYNKIIIKITDLGFGEFFDKTDYQKKFIIELD